MAQRYRKKPVVIEAHQWTSPGEAHDIIEWADASVDGYAGLFYDDDIAGPSDPETGDDWGRFAIETLEGEMTVTPRDYVIRGVQGEFYACKPDIFDATYEPAGDAT